jgi:hypothetical protein
MFEVFKKSFSRKPHAALGDVIFFNIESFSLNSLAPFGDD